MEARRREGTHLVVKAPSFIAGKLSFGGRTVTISIAVSYLVMILAVAISSGFREELRSAISTLSGDVLLSMPSGSQTSDPGPLSMDASYMDKIMEIRGIAGASPVIYEAGIIKSGEEIAGVMFKGVEGLDSLKVEIPSQIADALDLKEGDPLTAFFIGEKVKVRKFTVSRIYGLGRDEDLYKTVLMGESSAVVYAGLSDMQRVEDWGPGEVSAIELALEPSWRPYGEEIATEAGFVAYSYASDEETLPVAASSRQRYPRIYSWLDLVDFNVVILLILMTLVAGFNMISGLLIMLLRNTSTIGTLKSMGMTDKSISSVFLRVASRAVFAGMAAGNAAALLFCLVQGYTHVIPLNPENYMLSYVPVHVDIPMILAADLVSYVVIMVLLLIPCLFISKVDPAKTVKAD